MTRGLAAAAALLLLCAGGGPALAKPPVWVVRDADSEMVVFGSIHVLPRRLDWKPQALARALRDADDIWFELPVDAATEAEVAGLAGRRGVLAPDQSLFSILPAADSARLLRVARAYGVSPAVLDRLQPWMAEVALAAAVFGKADADVANGAERIIAGQAPATASRRALETPAEQVALFADTPMDQQLLSLRQTLQEMEREPDAFGALVRAWMGGDLAALERDALEPLRTASPLLFRRLVTDRNARWTQALAVRLKGRGRTVVVVGVGHLIGPGGVPARLRALGYSVQGP